MNQVDTRTLFRPLAAELLVLLRSLEPAQWLATTSAGPWLVRDVVAHLLDGDLRRLSVQRDGHSLAPPTTALRDYDGLVAYLNGLNAEWVAAAARLSPEVLTRLLASSSREIADLMESADPDSEAVFPVAWAGRDRSPMWLDIGREYTERWHHQDQIREAVGAPPLSSPQWLRPVIELSLFALPPKYASSAVPREATIALDIVGPSGGEWYLERRQDWQVRRGSKPDATCRISIEDLLFARLLHHGVKPELGVDQLDIDGERDLAVPLLSARAVMV